MTTVKTKTKKTTTTKAATTKRTTGKAKKAGVSPEQRYQMIEFAAYLRAEKRGFSSGSPEDDWFAAEREVSSKVS